MPSPFTMLLSTEWINDGTASEMLTAIRSEAHARQAIAARVLGAWPFDAHPDGFHLWLPIPHESLWSASELAQHLRSHGVAAVASAAFSTDGNPPAAIRICLGGPQDREQCRDGLQLVADALTDAHHLYGATL